MEKLIRVLVIIALALVCMVFSLTLIAVLKKPITVDSTNFEQVTSGEDSQAFEKEKVLFGDLGVLRAKTKDGFTLVVSPYFDYYANDVAFQEELVKKKLEMRKIILEFFTEKTRTEISNLGEEKIKEQILASINEILTLEKIEKLYFEKFIILDNL